MTTITRLTARRIWDSRGRPTVEVDVATASGAQGRGIAPAGASRGMREAVDLRDGGSRFGGMDVQKALSGVRGEITRAIVGMDVRNQRAIDDVLIALDGTPTKERLGGNALIATSLAVLHAAAAANDTPLWRHLAGDRPATMPLPQVQIFGGGAHAGRRMDVQDFMVIATGAKSFEEAMEMTAEVYRAAGALMGVELNDLFACAGSLVLDLDGDVKLAVCGDGVVCELQSSDREAGVAEAEAEGE